MHACVTGFIFGGVASAASFLLGTACGVCVLTILSYIKKKIRDYHGTQKSENINELELSENMAYETIRFPTSTF